MAMPRGEDIPVIRDMAMQCKRCGNYGFVDSFNKQGLCSICARAKAEQPRPERDSDSEEEW